MSKGKKLQSNKLKKLLDRLDKLCGIGKSIVEHLPDFQNEEIKPKKQTKLVELDTEIKKQSNKEIISERWRKNAHENANNNFDEEFQIINNAIYNSEFTFDCAQNIAKNTTKSAELNAPFADCAIQTFKNQNINEIREEVLRNCCKSPHAVFTDAQFPAHTLKPICSYEHIDIEDNSLIKSLKKTFQVNSTLELEKNISWARCSVYLKIYYCLIKFEFWHFFIFMVKLKIL